MNAPKSAPVLAGTEQNQDPVIGVLTEAFHQGRMSAIEFAEAVAMLRGNSRPSPASVTPLRLVTPADESPTPGRLREESGANLVCDLIDQYMAGYAGRDKSRISHLEFWRNEIGHLMLGELTSRRIRECQNVIASSPCLVRVASGGMERMRELPRKKSGGTINRYRSAISALLTWAIREGYAPEGWVNPCKAIGAKEEGRPREFIFTPEQYQQLLAFSRSKECTWWGLEAVLMIAWTTGARRGEIENLRWEWWDSEKECFVIPRTKNGCSRALPIVPEAWAILAQHQKASGLVFPAKKARPKRVIQPDGSQLTVPVDLPFRFEVLWQTALTRLGLHGTDACFHSLRHTAITRMISSGENTLKVGALVGHKSLSMTARYTHLQVDALKQMVVTHGG